MEKSMNTNKSKDKIGFGLASLILGAASVLLFSTCINFLLIVLSAVFGIIQLAVYRKKGMAVAGLLSSAVSLVLGIIFWTVMISSGYFLPEYLTFLA